MGWEWANHRDANMGVVYTNPWQFEQGTWGMKPWGMKPLFRHTHMEPNCNGDVDILKTMKPLLPGIAEGSLKAAWMDIPSLCLQNCGSLEIHSWECSEAPIIELDFSGNLCHFDPAAQFGWCYGCGGIPHAGGWVGESLGTFADENQDMNQPKVGKIYLTKDSLIIWLNTYIYIHNIYIYIIYIYIHNIYYIYT